MRLDSALKNVKSTMIVYIAKTILQFAVRMVFVRVLPIEYLGINGLFSNILAVLSLAELGIGPAIIFSLYKPLALGDSETVKSLMRLFKKTYISIGVVILILGVALTPWLDFFIQSRPDIDHLEWIYLLFVLDTGVSYFYSYKRNLLLADQKQFVANFYQGVFQVALGILQMIFLVVTQSFWPFIILKVLATFLENVMVARKADTLYPLLHSTAIRPLDSDIKQTIVRNVEAMIFHKVGGIAVFSTSNIIISKFVGLTAVGLYSNYYLIINSIQGISGQIFGSLTASVGNLVAVEGQEKKIAVFKILQFLTAWIAFYISIGLYVMFNPLIELWLGPAYVFADSIVFVMVLNFYLTYMRKGVETFKDAMGLFWNNRYMPIAETIINLSAGIYLVQKYDIVGALLAMTISTVLTCFWIEPYVVMRNGLAYPLKRYFAWYGVFTFLTVAVGYGLQVLYRQLWPVTTLVGFIAGVLLCTVIANGIWIAVFYRTAEFRYVKQLLINTLLHRRA
jgi:O-antigen/teichoic acid export membrane protein